MPESEIRDLVRQLGASIDETLSGSPKINESIRVIRAAGYEVFLSVEARVEARPDARPAAAQEARERERVHLRITEEDAKFLKSLKIAIDDPA